MSTRLQPTTTALPSAVEREHCEGCGHFVYSLTIHAQRSKRLGCRKAVTR